MKPTDEELEAFAERVSQAAKGARLLSRSDCRFVAALLRACKGRVKVKPLEWQGDETLLHDLVARPDSFHSYTVRPLRASQFDVILNHELGTLWFRHRKGEVWPDYASAKAAAQADYEARILAALEQEPGHE